MTRSALLSLHRSLTRHPVNAVLTVGGLAVGIAVFLVLGLFVRLETGFERWVPGHQHIYQVQEYWDQPGSAFNGYIGGTMGALIDELRADFPDTVATRLWDRQGSVIRGGIGSAEHFTYVDPNFLRLLPLPMVAGRGDGALADPANLLVSAATARKYFGTADAIGRPLTLNVDGDTHTYRVAGVFRDLPPATEFTFTILGRMPRAPGTADDLWTHWGSERVNTFLHFPDAAAARAYAARLPAFVRRHAAKDLGDQLKIFRLSLEPLADRHLQTPGLTLTVTTIGLVGLLTLLIAAVNYVNLATARVGLRAREVAMRKVLGASRAALLRQFLGEAVLTVLLAALAGLVLAELGLPFVNAAGGLALALPYRQVVPALLLLALALGLAAGFYPAAVLARFPAAAVLASARSPGGGQSGTRLRELLVVVQFALAISFVIGAAVLVAQLRHIRQSDPGLRRDNLLVVSSTNDAGFSQALANSFYERARRLPHVSAVVGADSVPGYDNYNSSNIAVPGRAGDGPSIQWIRVGAGFFPLFHLHFVAGREFDRAHRLDIFGPHWKDPVNVVINRQASLALGFATPEAAIGRTVGGKNPRTIIGVVEDARFFSPRDPITPMLYYFDPEPRATMTTLRLEGDPRIATEAVRQLWRQVAPAMPFAAATTRQNMADYYRADERATRLFTIGAGLAVLIGCIGLWGLASFNTQRRVKEIGIRKTLGASSAEIARLLVGQFLRPVLLANLLAWPLAFVAMRLWLAGFDDRIGLSPWFFLGAGAGAVAIASLTVLGQSLRASRAAPAWALRQD